MWKHGITNVCAQAGINYVLGLGLGLLEVARVLTCNNNNNNKLIYGVT